MSMPRLKIAFVVDRFGNRYGGAEAYGVALMRQLAQRHDVTVFAREYDADCDLVLPFVPLRSWKGLPSWIRVLLFSWRAHRATRQGYDVVHSHMNGWCGDIEVIHVTPVRYNWRVRALPMTKRLLSYISPRVQTYLGLESRRVAQRPAHRAVAVSGLIADQLKAAYGGANYPIIPPGVSVQNGPVEPDRARIRQGLNFAADDYVSLLVARNPLRKGLPTVLRAMSLLSARHKLLIVGSNAATRDFIHKTPEFAALADRISLVEETSDVAPYYRAADVYVHPTLNDSFGMAPLEAMSFQLPVILSPAPWCGFAQYVRDGHEALVLKHPEDHQELALCISRVSDDPACRSLLVEGGNAVVARHSWEEVASSYLGLYAEVIAEREYPAPLTSP